MKTMTNAGEFLRRYSKKRGYTQKVLAEKMGLTESHMSQVINGVRRQIEEKTLSGILDELAKHGDAAGFLEAYMQDIIPAPHSTSAKIVGSSKSSVAEKTGRYSVSAYDELIEAVKLHPAPEKVAAMVTEILKNAQKNKPLFSTLKSLATIR